MAAKGDEVLLDGFNFLSREEYYLHLLASMRCLFMDAVMIVAIVLSYLQPAQKRVKLSDHPLLVSV